MTGDLKRLAGARVLIFDLDGTLIDSKDDLVHSVNATLKHFGREPLDAELVSKYVGRGAPTLVRLALGEGADEKEVEEGLAYFLSYYRAHMLDNTVPYPGVREGLEMLATYSMAILTNKPVRFSQLILEGLDMLRYFPIVYGGNSFEKKKPDPIGIETILKDFGAVPPEAMMIGDSEVDVQTARNSGAWAVGVSYGLGSDRLAACPPDLLLDSLIELPEYLSPALAQRSNHDSE